MESFNHSQYHIQSRQQNKQRPLTPNSGLAGTKQNFKNLNKRVEYQQQKQQRPLTQYEQRLMLQQQQQRLTHPPPPPPPPPPHLNQSSSLQNTSHYQRPSQTPQFNSSNHKSFTEPSQQLIEQHKIPKSARLEPRQYVQNPQQNRHGLQSHRGYYQNSTNPFHKAKLSAPRYNNIHSQSQILYTMPSQFNGTMSYQNLPDFQPQQQKQQQQQHYKPEIQRPNQSYNGKKSDNKIPLSHMYKQNSKQAKISSKRAKNQAQQQQQQYQQSQYIRSKIALKNKEKMKFNLDKIDFSDLDSAFVALKSYVDHCKDASDRYTSASQIDLKQSVRIQTAGTQNLHTTNGFMELSQMQQPKELTPSQIMTNSQFEEKKTWENVEQKKYLTQQSQFPKVY